MPVIPVINKKVLFKKTISNITSTVDIMRNCIMLLIFLYSYNLC